MRGSGDSVEPNLPAVPTFAVALGLATSGAGLTECLVGSRLLLEASDAFRAELTGDVGMGEHFSGLQVVR